MGRYGKDRHTSFVTENYDSSDEKNVKQDFDSANENRKSIIRNLRDKIKEHRSPEARENRRQKKLEKQDKEIESLERKAKKEKLKGSIRHSRTMGKPKITSANSRYSNSMSYPKTDYSGMDNMLGFGKGNKKTSRSSRTKKSSSNWDGMDRMLGFKK